MISFVLNKSSHQIIQLFANHISQNIKYFVSLSINIHYFSHTSSKFQNIINMLTLTKSTWFHYSCIFCIVNASFILQQFTYNVLTYNLYKIFSNFRLPCQLLLLPNNHNFLFNFFLHLHMYTLENILFQFTNNIFFHGCHAS
jgi:hypothetical protein